MSVQPQIVTKVMREESSHYLWSEITQIPAGVCVCVGGGGGVFLAEEEEDQERIMFLTVCPT